MEIRAKMTAGTLATAGQHPRRDAAARALETAAANPAAASKLRAKPVLSGDVPNERCGVSLRAIASLFSVIHGSANGKQPSLVFGRTRAVSRVTHTKILDTRTFDHDLPQFLQRVAHIGSPAACGKGLVDLNSLSRFGA
jgi:hypothetical protein